MRWEEITVNVGEEARDAVINLFYEAGATGVVIEDTKSWETYTEEGLWDAYEAPQEVLDAENVLIKGYLPDDESLQQRLCNFRADLERLSDYFTDYNAQLSLKKIEDEDWETEWKRYYRPERIGERVVIRPSWEEYDAQPDDIVISLDPGMAFGTGQHPTTGNSLRLLERYLQAGSEVADVGCGSGILSITAARMGAAHVLAVDNDPTAIKIAKRNVAANDVEGRVEVCLNDLLVGVQGQFDLVLANLVADLIVSLLPQAVRRLKPGGRIVASGILADKEQRVRDAFQKHGIRVCDELREAEWVTLGGVRD